MPRLLLIVFVVLTACRADDEIKQGEVGEFCNGRDIDCRHGLICAAAVCTLPGPSPTYDCGDICNRLFECEAAEPGCESDCRITSNPWALRAREEFGVCVVEDLPCEDARAAFAPQTCYSEIEIPDARWTVCLEFVNFAQTCGAENADAERVLEGCAAVARVSPDLVWQQTAGCTSAVETGNCSEVATCFNQELGLDPAIEFVIF